MSAEATAATEPSAPETTENVWTDDWTPPVSGRDWKHVELVLSAEAIWALAIDPEERCVKTLNTPFALDVSVAWVRQSGEFPGVPDDGQERMALFLSLEELRVLDKMVGHVLKAIKISAGARQTLETLQPRLARTEAMFHDCEAIRELSREKIAEQVAQQES